MPHDHHVLILAAGCSRRLSHLTTDRPKSFLPVHGRRMLDYNLDSLADAGMTKVTLIVGYREEVVRRTLGSRYRGMQIDYVSNGEFAHTGSAWSLFLARERWRRDKRPALLVHADIAYRREILRDTLAAPEPNVIATDNHYEIRTRDEVVVCGSRGRVTGLHSISGDPSDIVGELVGISRWSSAFLDAYFDHLEAYFGAHGRNVNWEPAMQALLEQPMAPRVSYALTNGLPWVNVNYEEDLRLAEAVHAWRRSA